MVKNMMAGLLLLVLFTGTNCQKKEVPSQTRSFYMGVTPWPADFTTAELDTAYQFINDHCDIVSHHFDDGIPYQEAYQNLPLPLPLQQDIQTRKAKTQAGKKVFLSVSALNLSRKEKADYYRNAIVSDSTRNFWKQLPFNDARIVTAYTNYISQLIDDFHPLYVNYGVESNLLTWDAVQFALYKDFLRQVYAQLKTKYPNIPFLLSFIVDESTSGLAYASQLLPYTDFIGLSAYPYVNISSSASGNTDPGNFPADYFNRFINLDASKPLAITETGYIAEDLQIPSFNLQKTGRADWQNKYLDMICQLCNNRHAKLLIWYCSKDYDAGNTTLHNLGLYNDLFGLWQDTGLKDEAGRERPSFLTWLKWINKSKD